MRSWAKIVCCRSYCAFWSLILVVLTVQFRIGYNLESLIPQFRKMGSYGVENGFSYDLEP